MRSLRWLMGIAGLMAIMGVLAGGRTPAMAENKIVIYAAEDEKTTAALTKLFTAADRHRHRGHPRAGGRHAGDPDPGREGCAQGRRLHRRLDRVPPAAGAEGLVVPYRLAGRRGGQDRPGVRQPGELLAWLVHGHAGDHPQSRSGSSTRSRRRAWPSRRPGTICSIPPTPSRWSAARRRAAAAPTSSWRCRSSAMAARNRASTG